MRERKDSVTQEDLRKAFLYDASNGQMVWRPRGCLGPDVPASLRRWNTRWAGKPAGTPCGKGYIVLSVTVEGRHARIMAHRAVWIYHHGAIGSGLDVDHINRNRSDNRLENLRLATRSENNQNSVASRNCKTGILGVSFHKPTGKYRADIVLHRRQVFLGLYPTQGEAEIVRRYAERILFTHSRGPILSEEALKKVPEGIKQKLAVAKQQMIDKLMAEKSAV